MSNGNNPYTPTGSSSSGQGHSSKGGTVLSMQRTRIEQAGTIYLYPSQHTLQYQWIARTIIGDTHARTLFTKINIPSNGVVSFSVLYRINTPFLPILGLGLSPINSIQHHNNNNTNNNSNQGLSSPQGTPAKFASI